MAIGEGILIGISIIAFSFAYLSANISKKHGPLQILFVLAFSIISLVELFLMTNYAEVESITNMISSLASGFSWFVVLIFAYFFIYMVYKAFEMFKE